MERFEEVKVWDEIDAKLGFERFESSRAEGEERDGWLVNMHQVGCGVCTHRRAVLHQKTAPPPTPPPCSPVAP